MTAQAPGRPVMADPASGWRDSLIRLRTRVISNPRFQRWAAASPLTRFIARRQARALFDLCAGFVYSQVLAAFVQLAREVRDLQRQPRRLLLALKRITAAAAARTGTMATTTPTHISCALPGHGEAGMTFPLRCVEVASLFGPPSL